MKNFTSILCAAYMIILLAIMVPSCRGAHGVETSQDLPTSTVEIDMGSSAGKESCPELEKDWEKGCEVYHNVQSYKIDEKRRCRSIAEFMRYREWVGMGDTLTDYPEDSILYNGLKIDGKSIYEVIDKFGGFTSIEYDTLIYGMSKDDPSRIYPLTYDRAFVPIIIARKDYPNKVRLTVYFEHYNDSTKAIYGYQFGH